MVKTYRQGDVLLQQVESLPPNTKQHQPEENRIVLAYGETTGHAHALSLECATLYFDPSEQERYLVTMDGARLVHEEHAPIMLAPGVYRVVQQREYVPAPAGIHPGRSPEERVRFVPSRPFRPVED